jgi:hypothetical protein
MRTIKRRKPLSGYKVGDRVATVRGDGCITYIFPNGPHRKATFAVRFGRGRHGVIFNESEISRIGNLTPASQESKSSS